MLYGHFSICYMRSSIQYTSIILSKINIEFSCTGGITSRVLRETSVPILPRKTCNASYVRVASNRFPQGITENLLCAGDPDGGKDACQVNKFTAV